MNSEASSCSNAPEEREPCPREGMHRLVLCIGSNCSLENVEHALGWLAGKLSDFSASGIYETPAVSGVGSPYKNCVVTGASASSFEEFNLSLKKYEEGRGRDAEARLKGLVPVDVDIVVWDGEVVRQWDYRQNFFRIGFEEVGREASELTRPVV